MENVEPEYLHSARVHQPVRDLTNSIEITFWKPNMQYFNHGCETQQCGTIYYCILMYVCMCVVIR